MYRIDAPSHFARGLASIDRIPASRLVCSAVLVSASKGPNELIEPADFLNQPIRKGDTVVIATGWEKRSAKKTYMTENPRPVRAGRKISCSEEGQRGWNRWAQHRRRV